MTLNGNKVKKEEKMIYAKDFKCQWKGCDKQADKFMTFDIDIPSYKFCEEHVFSFTVLYTNRDYETLKALFP